MAMVTQERLEQIVGSLLRAHGRATCPDFRAIWLSKVQEILRTELSEMKLTQQERRNLTWQ
jgi:hypothetical protein